MMEKKDDREARQMAAINRRLHEAFGWIGAHHPELLVGISRVGVVLTNFPVVFGLDAMIGFRNNRILLRPSVALNADMSELVGLLSHELYHLQDGFMSTIAGKGRDHDWIGQQQLVIESEHRVGLPAMRR